MHYQNDMELSKKIYIYSNIIINSKLSDIWNSFDEFKNIIISVANEDTNYLDKVSNKINSYNKSYIFWKCIIIYSLPKQL